MKGFIKWVKFKGWFIFDLPYFIKNNNFKQGLELGAKGGRSIYYMLKINPKLYLTGVDLWEVIEGSAYKNNNKNEQKCKHKLRRFKKRDTLIKGDAMQIEKNFSNEQFDFIFYDIKCDIMKDRHQEMFSMCLKKIKKGGVLIGRDFKWLRQEFYNLGYKEEDIKKCKIGKRTSERLEFLTVK